MANPAVRTDIERLGVAFASVAEAGHGQRVDGSADGGAEFGPGAGPENGPENGAEFGPGNRPGDGAEGGLGRGPGDGAEGGLGRGPGDGAEGGPTTAAGRLVFALAARRRSEAGPIAVVSCDNLANNRTAVEAAIHGLALAVDPALARWIQENVSFVGTSVDRITPRTTAEEIRLVAAETGFQDSSPVVTEPFSNWVLSGEFPAGRPDWGAAGAVFVDDIEPFENRKLWLLNGAHSLLAYAGSLRGHETVAQALADVECRAWVTEFWDEAEANLPDAGLDIPAYREALLRRFSNGRIAHYLAQIGMDGSSKLRMRAIPVLKAELAAGRSGTGAARMIGSWLAYLRARHATGGQIQDAAAGQLVQALNLPAGRDARALLGLLDPELAADQRVLDLVESMAVGISAATAQ
ncbi:mannitol dehydrogenase family protein [Paenarthrobacter sp. Z7-10]|nr:mannitol dehydrogenase family protein [Paenarthrobacter sp. Z7-10]